MASIKKKKNLTTSKLDLNVRKRLVNCYIWSIAVRYCNWMLLKVDQKPLESNVMCFESTMGKIRWTDRVRNEQMLH
jgi:hypothetical protein